MLLLRTAIDVYTAAGFYESSIKWDKARIIALGWSDSEHLVVVAEDATVHLFDVNQRKFLHSFNMGQVHNIAAIPVFSVYEVSNVLVLTPVNIL